MDLWFFPSFFLNFGGCVLYIVACYTPDFTVCEIIPTGNSQKLFSILWEKVCFFRNFEKYSLNFVWESFLQKYINIIML